MKEVLICAIAIISVVMGLRQLYIIKKEKNDIASWSLSDLDYGFEIMMAKKEISNSKTVFVLCIIALLAAIFFKIFL